LYPGNAASILEQAQGTRSTRSLKELKNPYARKKKAVGINLSPEVVDYFK
jgi:hypothetical protein